MELPNAADTQRWPQNASAADPRATVPLSPGVAGTLVGCAAFEGLHRRALPTFAVTDSSDLRPIRPLGEGGMGRVLLANQSSLDREVAVKSALHSDEDAVNGLILEGVITGKLEHPNIPPVHQLGRDALGNPLLVMKRIEGVRWSELLKDPKHPARRDNPLFLREDSIAHLEILIQVGNALHYAHSRGVFHRDVKPDNVMIGRFGEVYLIDWGIAWSDSIHGQVETGPATVGTAAYMAPELVRGERPDARTDVYLLGATLHQVLTGSYRHDGPTVSAALAQALRSEPVEYGDDVPPGLASLCNRATSPKREDRPASAFELVQEIRAHLAHRASIELAARAGALLGSLAAMLETAYQPLAVSRTADECRFAFDEALRGWPENAAAKEGRARLLRMLVDLELREENANAARAWIAELGPEGASLVAGVDALEERLAERKRLEHRAREAERQADLGSGRRAREWFLGLMVVLGLSRTAYRQLHPLVGVSLHDRLVMSFEVGLLFFGAPILAALFGSRLLARTEAGRGLLRTMAIASAAIIVHRATALFLLTPIRAMLFGDCLIAATAFFVSALRQGWWIAGGGVAALATGFGLFVFRNDAMVMNVGAVCTIVALLVGQRRAARPSDQGVATTGGGR